MNFELINIFNKNEKMRELYLSDEIDTMKEYYEKKRIQGDDRDKNEILKEWVESSAINEFERKWYEKNKAFLKDN